MPEKDQHRRTDPAKGITEKDKHERTDPAKEGL